MGPGGQGDAEHADQGTQRQERIFNHGAYYTDDNLSKPGDEPTSPPPSAGPAGPSSAAGSRSASVIVVRAMITSSTTAAIPNEPSSRRLSTRGTALSVSSEFPHHGTVRPQNTAVPAAASTRPIREPSPPRAPIAITT